MHKNAERNARRLFNGHGRPLFSLAEGGWPWVNAGCVRRFTAHTHRGVLYARAVLKRRNKSFGIGRRHGKLLWSKRYHPI